MGVDVLGVDVMALIPIALPPGVSFGSVSDSTMLTFYDKVFM